MELCPHCEQALPADFHQKRKLKKSLSGKYAVERRREQGLSVGRQKKFDCDTTIVVLRLKGLTIKEIASSVGCSTWVVQQALKRNDL